MEKEKTSLSFKRVEKAIVALALMATKPMQEDRGNIDATIQRFEFTIELFWKLLRNLLEMKGVFVQYPKDVLREAYRGHFIEDEQVWLSMLQDRNLTSHTYDEALADQIYKRIQNYVPVFQTSYAALKTKFLCKC